MAKRFTDTNKYKKPFIRALPCPYKLLWDYLYHDCDHAGIWIVDFEIAQIYIGQDAPVTKQKALQLFNQDETRIIELEHGTRWFIKDFVEFQYGVLSEENRAHKSVIQILKTHGVLEFLNKPLISPLQGAKVKDKVKDKDKDKEKDKDNARGFQKPTIEEIEDYCDSRNNKVNAQSFFNFYESKGWMIGKNKMKNWRAAVHTWENKDNGTTNSYGSRKSMVRRKTQFKRSDETE